MSNFVAGLLAFAWFGAGIGLILLTIRGFKSLKEWAEIQLTAFRAHRLNARRDRLYAAIKRVGGNPDWEAVCRIIKE